MERSLQVQNEPKIVCFDKVGSPQKDEHRGEKKKASRLSTNTPVTLRTHTSGRTPKPLLTSKLYVFAFALALSVIINNKSSWNSWLCPLFWKHNYRFIFDRSSYFFPPPVPRHQRWESYLVFRGLRVFLCSLWKIVCVKENVCGLEECSRSSVHVKEKERKMGDLFKRRKLRD